VLHLPDPGIVELVMATVAANRMSGNPLWPLLVGPPGSGKTAVVDALSGLPDVHAVSTFSEAGLLSGSPVKDGDRRATGGLLVGVGEAGLLAFKDMTTIFSEHGSTRGRLFACLREVYDGHYTRRLGTEGGRTLSWQGKAGLIGGVTDAVDMIDLGLLGERFVYYRLPVFDDAADYVMCKRVLANVGHEHEHRDRLARDVASFFSMLELPAEPPPIDAFTQERLVVLATLGARCRSTVVRDNSWDRNLELVPSAEKPSRLLAQLGQLHSSLTVIGVNRSEAWRLVRQVAFDGMHKTRRSIFDTLRGAVLPRATSTVAGYARLPERTVVRHLDDLFALGIVEREKNPDRWELSSWVRDQLEALELPDLGGAE
jgi:DNA-binding transcriptional ArsR family regulator